MMNLHELIRAAPDLDLANVEDPSTPGAGDDGSPRQEELPTAMPRR